MHSQFLPNWFVRRRALAIGIAFSGVGAGGMVLLPWLQSIILHEGWRTACWVLGVVMIVVLAPINLLVSKSPEALGLLPDGEQVAAGGVRKKPVNVVDAEWAAVEWTVARAIRTGRFWWIVVSFFCGGYIWYAVQVHQTKYLVEIGFKPMEAAWSLGIVAMASDSWPDRARRAVRPDRARDRLVAELRGLRGLLRGAAAVSRCAVAAAALADGPVAGAAGLRLHGDDGTDRGGDLRRPALRLGVQPDHGVADRRRRAGAAGHRPAVRLDGQLPDRVRAGDRAECRLRSRAVAGVAAEGAGGGGEFLKIRYADIDQRRWLLAPDFSGGGVVKDHLKRASRGAHRGDFLSIRA